MTAPDRDRDEPLALLAPETERELCEALRGAWAPAELDPELNEALIAAALEDPLAPPTEEEIIESQRLRAALDGGTDHPDARLAEALRVAAAPSDLPGAQSARLARRAVRGSGRSHVIYVAFGTAAGMAALAAGLVLAFSPLAADPQGPAATAPRAIAPDIAVSRSTAPIFNQPFKRGQTTSRVDRIALSRQRDLRRNRYAQWGVR